MCAHCMAIFFLLYGVCIWYQTIEKTNEVKTERWQKKDFHKGKSKELKQIGRYENSSEA